MIDYPMCPTCRVADVEVRMARDVRDPCPHCGGVLFESLRICCLPDCTKALPVTEPLPVCRDCGIKIAVFHLHDASRHHAVTAERRRRAEEHAAALREGRTGDAEVYYVRLDAERIKIGFTTRLHERVRSYRVHPTNLLAVEPGGRDVEKARHAQFAAERIDARREDFEPSDRLMQWIADLRERNDLPAWAKVPDTRVKKLA